MTRRPRLNRLLRLIELLQSGRLQNSAQLAEASGVSRRTVFRDIGMLQQAGLHVLYDEERQGYFLPQRLTLPPGELTIPEAMSLVLICQELGSAGEGIPFQEAACAAADKICSCLPTSVRDVVAEVTERVSIRLNARNPLEESQGTYGAILSALVARRNVRISYRSVAEKSKIQTLLSPYRILFSRRSWYVVGRSSIHRAVRTFNISRVLTAEVLEQDYRIPPRFNLDRYLGNAWHLIREPEAHHEVVVRFQPMVAQNVAEIRWHKTQQIHWNDDGTLDFHVTVEGLSEIQWWILGYGDQAEVLRPAELRVMLRDRIGRMALRYAPEVGPTGHPPHDATELGDVSSTW